MNSSRLKRVLLISGFRIFPSQTGGHIHSGGIARALGRMGYSVLVYSLAGRNADYNLSSVFGKSFRVDVIERDVTEETNLGLFFGLFQAIGRRLDMPRVWQYYFLKRGIIPRRLKKALREADIVLSDMPWCPPIPGAWRTKPWFLVSHNLEYVLLEQETTWHRKFAKWMRRIESAAPQVYTDILPCAEEDRKFYQAQSGPRALALPIIRCGVDPETYKVPAGTRTAVRAELGLTDADTLLVFSGSRFGPNQDALDDVREFCKQQAAFLAQHRVYILALGSMLSEPIREGALIGTGRVPETTPYFAASDAGLNPITRGSGANVKLFEYLAARLPVISTAFGVRGTALQPDTDYIAYERETLASAVSQFLTVRTRDQWRQHAEDVWMRHRSTCDIGELVKDALRDLPSFPQP